MMYLYRQKKLFSSKLNGEIIKIKEKRIGDLQATSLKLKNNQNTNFT